MAITSLGPEKSNMKTPLKIVLALVLIALVTLPAFYFYSKYKTAQEQLSGQSQAELKDLQEKIGKLYKLPEGETPTLATVSNIENLRDQEFFARAENGDKVLIYSVAKRAILYRPSINKIIEIAPVIGDLSPEGAEQPEEKILTVAILNGTSDQNSTYKASSLLDEGGMIFSVVKRGDAGKKDYLQTIVVDLTGGTQQEVVEQMAANLNGSVSTLPEGEEKPTADILIITGANILQ